MSIYSTFRSAVRHELRSRRYRGMHRRLSEFTMTTADAYVDNMMLVEHVKDVPGCVVECGVWRGGMTAGMAMVLGSHRDYFLFDSFEGLPPAKEIDGEAALKWQSDKNSPQYYDNCRAEEDYARRAMELSGASSFKLIKGWFNETLPGFKPPGPIALLRIDADWYESTMTCFEALYDSVVVGGMILLDDYHTWDGCSRAVHEFLSRRSAVERIRNQGEVGYLRKR